MHQIQTGSVREQTVSRADIEEMLCQKFGFPIDVDDTEIKWLVGDHDNVMGARMRTAVEVE